MAHFFERRDRWGNSPALWIVAFLVFSLPIGWWSLQQIHLENDVAHWLPADNQQLRVLDEAQRLFPSAERLLVSWDGSSLNDPRVDKFRQKIVGITDDHGIQREGLKAVAGVVDPSNLLIEMQRQEIEPQEAARRLHGVLLGAGPLRVKLTQAGRQRFRKTRTDLGKAVRQRFNIRLDVVGPTENLVELAAIPLPATDDDESVERAAPAVLTSDGKLTTRENLDHDLQLTWNGIAPGTPFTQEMVEFLQEFRWRGEQSALDDVPLIEDCFFVLGSPIALAVDLSEAGAADKAQTLLALQATAESVGIPPETLKLGGAAVSEVTFNQMAAQAIWNPQEPISSISRRSVILLAVFAGAAMTFLMIRSVRLTAIALGVSLYVSLMTTALIPATGGGMNLLLAVLPTVLTVWTLTSSIFVINQWKRALAANPETAVVDLCRTTAMPCGLSGILLAMACLALCASPLQPVRELGLYAAAGVVLCLGMMLYGLPAMLQLCPMSMSPRWELHSLGWRVFGHWFSFRPTLQASMLVICCGILAMGMKELRTEAKVTRYFPATSGIVQDYQFLENQLAGIVPVELLIRFDPTAQQQANFLQRLELVRTVEEKLRSHPDVTGCLSFADFQPVTELPSRDAGLLTMTRFHKQANALERQLQDGEMAASANWYRQIPGEPSVGTIDPQLAPAGEELWRITAQVMVLSSADYATILAELERISRTVLRYQPGSQHVLTGAVPLFLQTQQAMLASLIRGSILGLAILGLAYVVLLKNLGAGLIALACTAIPVPVLLGAMGWMGLRVDFGVVLAAIIVVGFSMLSTVQLLTVFRRKTADGTSRSAAVVAALETTGPAMVRSGAIVLIGMSMLIPAELALIGRFGLFAAAMTGMAIISQVVLLPLCLLSPLGAWFAPQPTRNFPAPPEPPGKSEVPRPHISTANLRIPSR